MIAAGLVGLALLVAFGVYVRHAERRQAELIALIDRLCQRVQAPNAAVLEHDERVRALRDDEYAPPAVVPDDDEAYWMSRDKLAELAMAQELNDGR